MTQSGKKYDVVIIGSGLGGLVCGAILSKEGKSVCILEKNEQLGGNLQTFKRDGVTFDTGVHYIGGLDKGQNLYRIFNYLDIMNRLETEKMDVDGFDVILFKDDSEEYPYGMGYANFVRIMSEKFPEEKKAIEMYCKDFQRICNNFPMYNLRPGEDYEDKTVFTKGVKGYLEELTDNVKLRNVLAGNNLLYAGVADKTPLYMHALIENSYIEGAFKIKNGGDQIAKLLARRIKENGGDILRKTKVDSIEVKNGEADCVMLQDGSRIYGKTFISNLHPAQTLDLVDSSVLRPVYRERVKGLKNSISIFVVYVVLKPGAYASKNRNYYYFDEVDVWKGMNYTEENWPYSYALFECPDEDEDGFAEGLSIMSYMRFDDVKQWEQTINTTVEEGDRGKDYEAFKKQKAEKLLDAVAVKFPEIRSCIQNYYTSTPLSYRDYIGTGDGNMYGIIKDFNDPLKTSINTRTKIPNLFLTGQNTNMHGVLGVSIGAILTCMNLLGKEYLLNKITATGEKSS